MNITSTALVVIDMQNGFVTPHSAHVVPRVTRLVEEWQHLGGATVFTRYLNYPGSPYDRLIHWSKMQTAPETDLVEPLRKYADRSTVIDKKIYSLFTDEGLALVKENGWTDLVFCGIATESCVLKSAVDAFEAGFVPWVVRDACASHAGQGVHDAGLLITGRFIGNGQIIDTDSVLIKQGLAQPA